MSLAVRTAIFNKLNGDATLTGYLGDPPSGMTESIFHNEAPAAANYSFIVFRKQSGTPAYTFGAQAWDDELWLVKGVDLSTTAITVDAIATRLDAVLTDAALTISGLTHMNTRRESDVEYSEVDDGTMYVHAGALYRIRYQ